ncbi:MAG TPA: hypothetical protein EYG94_07385 [Campylobacterales bacterium]|nr:hypothetical protein [Campylobacterales bacterium]
MKESLKKSLLVLMLPFTPLMADMQLDFSSLVNEFMTESNGLKTIINLSGKQRMLTQRMSKLVVQIKLNVQKKQSTEKLKEMATLYAKTLKAFRHADSDLGIGKATNAKVLEQIAVVEKEWKTFYEHIQMIVDAKAKEESFVYILAHNEKLLKVSNELVKRYEASNTSSNYLEKARLRVVNVAGRQRMLTQKMTKEKLLLIGGNKGFEKKLEATVKLFDDSLIVLQKGDKAQHIGKATNEKIIKQLTVVSTLWSELKPLYLKKKNTSKELAVIISKNSVLLKEMNSMVLLAEKEVEY